MRAAKAELSYRLRGAEKEKKALEDIRLDLETKLVDADNEAAQALAAAAGARVVRA